MAPGSMDFKAEQASLSRRRCHRRGRRHPRRDRGRGRAIEHYTRVIEACDGVDWATKDMVIDILRDEEGHLRPVRALPARARDSPHAHAARHRLVA